MMWPACAKAASISPATEESRPEKTSLGARPGVAGQVGHAISRRRLEAPRGGLAVRLAFRSLTRAKPCHAKPRMVREQGDELLADHAGRAQDTDGNCGHRIHHSKKKPTRSEPCRHDVLARVFSRLTFERHTSDTVAGPLSAAALSHVGREAHDGRSIACRAQAAAALSPSECNARARAPGGGAPGAVDDVGPRRKVKNDRP